MDLIINNGDDDCDGNTGDDGDGDGDGDDGDGDGDAGMAGNQKIVPDKTFHFSWLDRASTEHSYTSQQYSYRHVEEY